LDALLLAIGVVAPIVIVLTIGNVFARLRSFTVEARGIGSLVYWLCLPALIWRDIARGDPGELFNPRLCFTVGVVLLIVGILAYRYARWIAAPVEQVGVLAQGGFRSNMLYVGFPIVIYHAAATHTDADAAKAAAAGIAAVTLIVAIPVLNAASILFFILPRRHEAGQSGGTASRVVKTIVGNPMIIGVILGVCFAILPPLKTLAKPSTVLGRTLDLLSAAALPLALISAGAFLNLGRAWRTLKVAAPIVAMKLLLMPALGLVVLWRLGVRDTELAVGVILLACPTAAASHALALEMKGDDELATDLVAVTTILCPFTIVMWLAVLQAIGAA
jgi:malate permease and related proteins